MMRLAMLLTLIGYAVVVSQPLAYIVFMTKAQRALSAPAYIELRQRINPVMTKRLPAIYVITLLALVLLLALSLRSRAWTVALSAAVALVCLVVDVVFMVRENVPINGIIDTWTTISYPADWQDYRAKWFATFAYRQVAQLAGFVSLLVGAVFRP
jgi:hypothetical protein